MMKESSPKSATPWTCKLSLTLMVCRIVALPFLFNACQTHSFHKSPQAYHDTLVLIQNHLIERANLVQESFESYIVEDMQRNLALLDEALKKTEIQISHIPVYEQNDSLKWALVQLMKHYMALRQQEYKTIYQILSKPDSTFSESDDKMLDMLYHTIDLKNEKAMQAFSHRRDQFLKKYGLKQP